MKVEIKNRFSGEVICSGDFESLKECVVKNRANLVGASLDGASLDGANLNRANLNRASLDGASLDGANLNRANLNRASLDGASLDGANLNRANLNRASLYGASLNRASLYGASLYGANLVGIKNYSHSHDIFQEVIRQQDSKLFTSEEWSVIGQICIHRLCWDTIKKRFKKSPMSIFKKLAKKGFKEWEKKYKEI